MSMVTICNTLCFITILICVTIILKTVIKVCCNRILVLDERQKKDALERLYLERNETEKIKALEGHVKDLEIKKAFLEKDLEIEKLKFQKDYLENQLRKDSHENTNS